MTETARLVIAVDSTGAKRATDDLDRLEKAGGRVERQTGLMSGAFKVLGGVLASAALYQAAGIYIRMADASANMSARLRLATRSQEEFNRAHRETYQIAQRTSTELGSVVDLYARMQQSTTELGVSQSDLLQLTETVTQTFQVSGATAQEAAGGLRQLSQAMAGGVLRAEEFNSIVESSPRLVQALADGLGISFGEVRKHVNEGKITSEMLVNALLSQSETIQREFGEMPITVGRATTQLRNAMTRLVGETDEAEGASRDLAEAIVDLAEVLESDSTKQAFSTIVGGITSVSTAAMNAINWVDELMRKVKDYHSPDTDKSLEGLIEQRDRLQRSLERREGSVSSRVGAFLGLNDGGEELRGAISQLDSQIAGRRALQLSAAISARQTQEGWNSDRPEGRTPPTGGDPSDNGGGGIDKHARALERLQDRYRGYLASLVQANTLHGENSELAKANYEIQASGLDRLNPALAEAIRQEAEFADFLEEVAAHEAYAAQELEDYTQAKEQHARSTAQLIDDMQFELSIMGLSNVEREKAIRLRWASVDATSAEGRAISDLVEELDRARNTRGLIDETKDSARSLFGTIASESGRATEALDRFFDNLKRRLAERTFDALLEGFAGMAGGGGWGGFASGFARGFTGGGKAAGGPAMAGQGYVVGDGDGPELFVPGQSGRIVPMGRGSLGGGQQVIVNIHNAPVGTEARESTGPGGELQIDAFIGGLKKEVAGDIANGGIIWQATKRRGGLRDAV